MINDWKLGIWMLRYAHNTKMSYIAMGLLLLLEIAAVALGRESGNLFPACYILLVLGMLPGHMLYSLSVAGMVQASPMKKKLQTKLPALMNFSVMSVIYLTGALLCGIMVWGKTDRSDTVCQTLILTARSLAIVMVYMGVAYKHFILATVGLVPALCFTLTRGLWGEEMLSWGLAGEGLLAFLGGREVSLWQVIPEGLVILAVGAVAEYLLSLLVYKAPMAKMAQTASLRREL